MAIQLKRSLTSSIDSNYVLLQGQIGIEMPSSTNTSSNPFKIKIGDGSSTWSNLPYFSESSEQTTLSDITIKYYDSYNVPNSSTKYSRCFVMDSPKIPSGSDISYYNRYIGMYFHGEFVFRCPYNLDLHGSNNVRISSNSTLSLISESSSAFYGLVVYPEYSTTTCSINPNMDNNHSLGRSDIRWTKVYATTGSIQTSDRKSKTNIRYLADAQAALVSDENVNPAEIISLEDVLSFIQDLNPTTFDYLYTGDSVPPANRQIGFIADDIQTNKLFPYIGVHETWASEPSEVDPDGKVIRPAREAGESLGLKPIPLAACALTACKYLLQSVDTLSERLDIVENKLAYKMTP